MKRLKNKIVTLLILLIGFSFNLHSENYTQADLAEISKIVTEFYDWYISSVKSKSTIEYSPQFVESANGMTTLDFSRYFDNLKRLNFSDSLLDKEKQFFKVCLKNLSQIEYSDFKESYIDLDHFEAIDCAFNNSRRWGVGQEMMDKIEIVEIAFENETAIVEVEYFDKAGNKFFSQKPRLVYMCKINNEWTINGFSWL